MAEISLGVQKERQIYPSINSVSLHFICHYLQLSINRGCKLIHIFSGHLGSGDWKIKRQDGIYFLSHNLAFSPRNEYRIGCDEILDVQVESIQDNNKIVHIQLSDERSCKAYVDEHDLESLLKMLHYTDSAPEIQDNTHLWVKGFLVFIAASLIFELLK